MELQLSHIWKYNLNKSPGPISITDTVITQQANCQLHLISQYSCYSRCMIRMLMIFTLKSFRGEIGPICLLRVDDIYSQQFWGGIGPICLLDTLILHCHSFFDKIVLCYGKIYFIIRNCPCIDVLPGRYLVILHFQPGTSYIIW